MGDTWSIETKHILVCSTDEVATTEDGEHEVIDLKIFLPVADAGHQRKHHHLDIEHQRHIKVVWKKKDNHPGNIFGYVTFSIHIQ